MTRAIETLAWAGLIVLIAVCSTAGPQPRLTGTLACPYPMAIIKAFDDSNDTSHFEASFAFLTPDATLSSWVEGLNGRHWQEKHLTGKEQIRTVLSNPGLRRTAGQSDAPIFHETEAKISGDQVIFMLQPDRLSPDGRPYNPYKVEVIFLGCKIKSLTVIELISWV
jgi:hypothetical protein